MTAFSPALQDGETAPVAAPWLTVLLAAACGLIVANLYYAQPLVGPISRELGLSPVAAGMIVTLTQIGYGAGLLLVVPLGDLLENRRLVVTAVCVVAAALLVAASAAGPVSFLGSALVIGLGAVAVQILVPYAAHLAPAATRGRVVGNVMSGLMLGIMLARPISSMVTELWSWHAMFAVSAVVMLALAGLLYRTLPTRRPAAPIGYGHLLASMARLVPATPVLRRRALYQAGLFGAFSLFWTTGPLRLAGPEFGLSQGGIALFALAGVAGAVAAPIAGRLADRGWGRPATVLSILTVAGSFLLTRLGEPGSPLALGLLTAAAILLDFGVSMNLVIGQRAIFALGAAYRSRLNGLYMATFFAGGAAGSALGGWAFAQGGWTLAAWIGFAMPVAALLYALTERRAAPDGG